MAIKDPTSATSSGARAAATFSSPGSSDEAALAMISASLIGSLASHETRRGRSAKFVHPRRHAARLAPRRLPGPARGATTARRTISPHDRSRWCDVAAGSRGDGPTLAERAASAVEGEGGESVEAPSIYLADLRTAALPHAAHESDDFSFSMDEDEARGAGQAVHPTILRDGAARSACTRWCGATRLNNREPHFRPPAGCGSSTCGSSSR